MVRNKFKDILLIGFGALFISVVSSLTTLTFAHGGNTTLVHACIKNSTPVPNAANVRIVSATTNCNTNETALDWNIQGVQGPAGPQGATGSAAINLPPFVCTYRCFFSDVSDKFKGKDFSNAYTRSLEFINVDMSSTVFKGNDMGADFTGSNLSNTDFSFSIVAATFINTNLTDADFGNTKLSNGSIGPSIFYNANLQNTNFQNADLTDIQLTNATNMNTANITGVTWSNTTCPDGTNSNNNGNTCVGHLIP